ncbi:hypothetical protein C0Q70_14522 [Pomacea canaliculata]|uniref:Uncharacterized protein n=1 Tax=Pomacea canaliculata TaxID=400727 RepID=A0A2T7NSD1_POMCA|nr:hypothetical protein C0Q70_14522 [Pomacea canaliculata]
MKEHETLEVKSVTESKEDAKQDRTEETIAAKVKQEHKEETKREVDHSQKLEAEAVREQKENNEDDDYETASDDDDADRSRNAEGAVDVDKLDGVSSTGQNLVYTDQSNPEQSQECSDGEKRQTIRGELVESVGHLKQVKDHDVIECNFHVEVTLSHVSFIDTEGEYVFGVVNCVSSCEVHNNYKDRLRIVSPHNTSLGNSFVFELSGSEMSAGRYTCYGLPKPQGVSPARDHDEEGEESQTTTLAQHPEADEVSQNEEALLGNGSNSPLHHGAAQRGDVLGSHSHIVDDRIDEGKEYKDSGVKGHQDYLRVSSNKVEYTKNKNTGVDVYQGSTHSSFSKVEKEQTKEKMEKKDYNEDDDYQTDSDDDDDDRSRNAIGTLDVDNQFDDDNEIKYDESVREQTADTRAETVKTGEELEKRGSNEDDNYETASDDDDDDDRSRNDEGPFDVDKLDGAVPLGRTCSTPTCLFLNNPRKVLTAKRDKQLEPMKKNKKEEERMKKKGKRKKEEGAKGTRPLTCGTVISTDVQSVVVAFIADAEGVVDGKASGVVPSTCKRLDPPKSKSLPSNANLWLDSAIPHRSRVQRKKADIAMAMKRSALYRQAEWNLMGCSWRRSTLAQWILIVEQYGGINKRKGIFKCAYLVRETVLNEHTLKCRLHYIAVDVAH